ncbi:LytTR family two component transcriptional regulator [Pedobacter psychrotolerans]|uniref:DNA-binding response regulator n=1 Tax=Pedobacter psychrotolerans TaxID=1843235 RepID=A0A4R2HI58_9SPHI|nr:LytTR family DNA-binding domain-containing protein [Pedobacter psychrotolerans]TCO28954.1 LytTR family two component transcriptional regulator [Pedobacter psychrotolerans]GGE53060.1 DNA-binding response regulator [Pedobacter psychrotolerans]
MIHCIIVDDEEHAIEVIQHYLKSVAAIHIVETFTNPIDALSFLSKTPIDLIFLDIHMPEISGIEFIQSIPLPRFLQAINKAQNILNTKRNSINNPRQDDYFMVKTEAKGKMLKINITEIDFVEGMKNYVAFHHNGIRTLALLTMKDVEDRLPKTQFIRVQKSFIVALNKITSIDGNRIILKGISAEILIGETYRKDFLDMMKQKLLL